MVCNRNYGGSVAGYGRDIADAQAMDVNGFALNCGSWNGGNYKGDTESMFLAAEQNAAAQLVAAKPLPPFKLFFSADMTGLTYPEVVQMMTAYAARPNYYKKAVPNGAGGTDLRPFLSTWGGEGGTFQQIKDRWNGSVLAPLRAAGINPFFVPRFFLTFDAGAVANLAAGFLDGAFVLAGLGNLPPLNGSGDTLAGASAQIAALKAAGLYALGSITPQYWGSKQKTNGRAYYEFQGGEGLHLQYLAAILSGVDDLELFTWNDFDEATYFSPIDDVNKYWPFLLVGAANYYKPRLGYKNEVPYFNAWFKSGALALPPITQYEAVAYHRTMPNGLKLTDPNGTVYSGSQTVPGTAVTAAPDALDSVFLSTKFPAPGAAVYTGAAGQQTVQIAAGLQHTPFPFAVGPHSFAFKDGGGHAFMTLPLEPIVGTITPPAYNFNYASAVATAPYAGPAATTSAPGTNSLGAAMIDIDIVMGPALTNILENSPALVSGSDGYVHALVTATRSLDGTRVDLSGAAALACLVPLGASYDPAKQALAPAVWLPRTAAPAGEYLALAVGPHGQVTPPPGSYRLFAQVMISGEVVELYSAGSVVFQ